MRIISGKYKGLQVTGYDIVGTRPTMDRVKESLFAMIQTELKNSICLDLFAGSGSLGIEAISNYASECYFVDKNKKVIEILTTNMKKLNMIESYFLYNLDFKLALKKFHESNIKFNIIFLDPPYNDNLINPSLDLINSYDLLSSDGLIICEYEKEDIKTNDFILYKERKYGSKNIKIFKKAQ